MIGVLAGTHTLLVGVEDDPSGGLRCYLGARHKGLYVLVDGEEDKARVRRAWESGSGHIEFPIPPAECVHRDGVEPVGERRGVDCACPSCRAEAAALRDKHRRQEGR